MKIPPAAVAVAPGKTPIVGNVISSILAGFSLIACVIAFYRRIPPFSTWKTMPVLRAVLLVIYVDSFVFTLLSLILEHTLGLNSQLRICDAAIILIYYVMVEKVYVIRSVATPRLKSKMYCINTFGLLLPFSVTAILNFIYRLAYIDNQGHCTIGVKLASLLPLIIFDCVMNLVLTTQFVIPLRRQLSYRTGEDSIIRQVTIRSFVGSVCTLTSSVVNLSVLLSLDGEQAWICLLCCNADILFSVMMLHWVTSKDSGTSSKIAFSKKARQSGLPSNKGSQWAKLAYGPNLEQSKVVTQVEARVGKRVDPGNESDDIGVDEYEMGKIRVRTGHVVTVEEIKVEDEEIGRNNSEEDLVVKT